MSGTQGRVGGCLTGKLRRYQALELERRRDESQVNALVLYYDESLLYTTRFLFLPFDDANLISA